MPKIIYLVGPPCSGKTYYTQNTLLKQYPDAVIISTDIEFLLEYKNNRKYRLQLTNKIYTDLCDRLPYDKFPMETFIQTLYKRCHKKFEYATKNELNIIVDNTNLTPLDRAMYDCENYEKVIIKFETSKNTLVARMEERKRLAGGGGVGVAAALK